MTENERFRIVFAKTGSINSGTVFLLAGALSFNEKIRQSAALFWFGLRNDGIFNLRAAIQKTVDISRIYGVRFGEKDRGLSTNREPNKQED